MCASREPPSSCQLQNKRVWPPRGTVFVMAAAFVGLGLEKSLRLQPPAALCGHVRGSSEALLASAAPPNAVSGDAAATALGAEWPHGAALLASAGALGLKVRAATNRQKSRPRASRVFAVQEAMPATSSTEGSSCSAVVVGGGPAGLVAALMLAKRGWHVTVIERNDNPANYDPGRGFTYLIDGRGQNCLKALGGDDLFSRLRDASVGMSAARIGYVTPEGLKVKVNPIKDKTRESYWLPRHAFVQLLLDEVQKESKIQLICSATLESLTQEGGGVVASGSVPSGPFKASGTLLVGADGIGSAVRSQLEKWDGDQGRYVPRTFDSPAAGLRYKVLTLPGELPIDTETGPNACDSASYLAVPGVAPSGTKLRLGILPISGQYGMRTANAITNPADKFWEVSSVEELREYAKVQWPHFPIFDFVSEEELTRFAEDRGGRFPAPQHSPSAAWFPTQAPHGKTPAAVLVGDALHAFPPDLGQGVNSAMEDVMVLRDALDREGEDKGSLAAVAQNYEAERMPDTEALVQMMRVAAPFQYKQNVFRFRLWNLCFLARLLLNKASSFFDLPSFLQVQKSELRYREAWQRGRRGAFRATSAALLLLGGSAAALARLVH